MTKRRSNVKGFGKSLELIFDIAPPKRRTRRSKPEFATVTPAPKTPPMIWRDAHDAFVLSARKDAKEQPEAWQMFCDEVRHTLEAEKPAPGGAR